MKAFKIFSIVAVAALLLTPATAMARTNFSLSLNLFDCLLPRPVPVFVAPPPPPPVFYYLPPCPPRTIVKEYHYYHRAPQPQPVEELNPSPYYYYHAPQPR